MPQLRRARGPGGAFICSILLALACLVSEGASVAQAQGNPASPAASVIEGNWLVESRDAIIHIGRHGDQYEGRIVWQLHDTYGPEDGPDLNGKIVTDRNNPDVALRSQPLTGLRLLWGLRYNEDRHMWVDGHVYDSDNGKTYHCRVRLLDHDRLNLRGYIGISLFGGSTTWTRTRILAPAAASTATNAQ
ncbi:MAG: DUF2147 domain-containing protein [Rhodanobacter sp.]